MLIHVEYKPTITLVNLLRCLSGYTRVGQPVLLIEYLGGSSFFGRATLCTVATVT